MKNRNKLKWFLIISSIILGLSLIPAVVMLMFSVMMFDSPGSEESKITWGLFTTIAAYPFITFISCVLSWVLYYFKKDKISFIIMLLPYINILTGIAFIIALGIFCDGNFSC